MGSSTASSEYGYLFPGVKVPSNKYENRILKAGLEEDDNEDIAYLNIRLLWLVLSNNLI
jgi:hypothetical protein